MIKRKLLLGALAVSSIAIAPLPAMSAVDLYVNIAPPAPRYEVVPAPRAGYVWQPGVWEWRGDRHYWRKGAADLTAYEAARLAVMLPRPRYFEQVPNSGYLASRAQTIVARMRNAELP